MTPSSAGACMTSPSSRRAWIEILQRLAERLDNQLALLAEGVDRNFQDLKINDITPAVALLAEGVDRNLLGLLECLKRKCRPPRGGRG